MEEDKSQGAKVRGQGHQNANLMERRVNKGDKNTVPGASKGRHRQIVPRDKVGFSSMVILTFAIQFLYYYVMYLGGSLSVQNSHLFLVGKFTSTLGLK